MKDPNIKTKVVHSKSKPAWNIVGITLNAKYKIARIPYNLSDDENIVKRERDEAYEHAIFIAHCFNHSGSILN